MMMLSWLSLAAWSAPLSNGLQVQIHPAGFAFFGEQVAGFSVEVGPLDLSTAVDCYDPFNIDDFNLSLTIDQVTLTPAAGTLGVDVQLGTVEGTYWDVSAETGWFDTCFDFSVLVELIELQNGRLQGSLVGDVENGELVLAFARPPAVSGTLRSDIDWFPDDLVWSIAQDLVIDQITTALEEEVPTLVRDLTTGSLPLGEIAGVPVSIDVSAVEVSPEGLYAAVDVDLGTAGGPGPLMDLSPLGDSHVAIGITEAAAQQALDLTWATGLLDPDSETTVALIADLVAELDLGADVEASLGVGVPPVVKLGDDGLRLVLDQTELEVRSQGEVLLRLVVDLAATLDVTLDAQTSILGLSAHDVTLVVEELEADRLVADAEAEANLQAFLEGWVAQAASSSLSEIPLIANQFGALGYVLRIEDVVAQDQGVAVWATLYDEDDPAVDQVPPDSEVTVTTDGAIATATFAGTDDREGALSYSWRADGGGWSSWQLETTAEVALTPGPHTLEVQTRDNWQNIDPTPGLATFDIVAAEVPESGGCGCAAGTGGAAVGVWALLGLVVARRR